MHLAAEGDHNTGKRVRLSTISLKRRSSEYLGFYFPRVHLYPSDSTRIVVRAAESVFARVHKVTRQASPTLKPSGVVEFRPQFPLALIFFEAPTHLALIKLFKCLTLCLCCRVYVSLYRQP